MDPTILIAGASVVGIFAAWAVGHFGTGKAAASAAMQSLHARLSALESAHPITSVETAIQGAEHATAQAAADAAVKAIQWLTDKSKQQAIVDSAQAEMARMDALLAGVQAKLKPPGA